jgi:predicted GIY-YIG superfamily endonuclease
MTATNYIYVLKLRDNKFYVGKTDNVLRRCQEHANGTGSGSDWTKRFGVIDLIECSEEKSVFDEDNKTKQLMMKYGFDNVRGGSYSKFELTPEELIFLKKEFAGAMGLCFNCGRAGHYVSDCSLALATERGSKPVVPPRADLESEVGALASTVRSEVCRRCGRNSHSAEDCGAKTTLDGKLLCGRCGRATHATHECKLKTRFDGKRL